MNTTHDFSNRTAVRVFIRQVLHADTPYETWILLLALVGAYRYRVLGFTWCLSYGSLYVHVRRKGQLVETRPVSPVGNPTGTCAGTGRAEARFRAEHATSIASARRQSLARSSWRMPACSPCFVRHLQVSRPPARRPAPPRPAPLGCTSFKLTDSVLYHHQRLAGRRC